MAERFALIFCGGRFGIYFICIFAVCFWWVFGANGVKLWEAVGVYINYKNRDGKKNFRRFDADAAGVGAGFCHS